MCAGDWTQVLEFVQQAPTEWPAQLRSFPYLSVQIKQLYFRTQTVDLCPLVLCVHTQQ